MPQITVTLDEDVYFDLIHNLPKGMKSKFVNRAVKRAVEYVCNGQGRAMHAYAKHGSHAAQEVANEMVSQVKHPNQTTLHRRQAVLKGEEE